MPDLLAAIKDIYLGDLYYHFAEMFKTEIIESLCNLKDKNSATGEIKQNAGEFFITASFFMDGANGSYDKWEAFDKSGVRRNFTAYPSNAITQEFNLFLDRIIKIKQALNSPAFPLLKNVKNHVEKSQKLCAVIMSYGLLYMLRLVIGKEAEGRHAADLAFTHWDLGRKLRDILCRYGASENEAWRIIDIERVILSKTAPAEDLLLKKEKKFNAAEFAAMVIDENYLDADFRRILGINIFEDVAWFNKEGFEDALFYTSLFFMVEGSVKISMEERIDRIVKTYDVLKKAEEKSGYRFDNLLEYLVSLLAKTKPVKAKSGKAKQAEVKSEKKKTGAKETDKSAKTKPAGKTEAKKANKPAAKPKSKSEAKTVKKPGAVVKAKSAKPVKAKAGQAKSAKPKPKVKAEKPKAKTEKAKSVKSKTAVKTKGKKK